VGIGIDVFAYTQDEVDAMLASGNAFLAQALREGITLVNKADEVRKGNGR